MKTLAVVLSVILLFSATNVAFSQTSSNSTDQCKTVMHEQIIQKKVNGKIKSEKIQVPLKICKDPNIMAPINKTTRQTPKISESVKKQVDTGVERVKVYVFLDKTPLKLWPTKPSGDDYKVNELSVEEVKTLRKKQAEHIKEIQKDFVKFVTDNGGIIKRQDTSQNFLTVEIPSSLLPQLEQRLDVKHVTLAGWKIFPSRMK